MKIALAQINPTVGDIPGNTAKIAHYIEQAETGGAQLVVFPELSVLGYPPRDLLSKEQFVAEGMKAVHSLAKQCKNIAALVGFVRPTPSRSGRPLQNVAGLLSNGGLEQVLPKTLLPTYDVFDETRYFEPGDNNAPLDIAACRVGVSICEDLWDPLALGRELYRSDPVGALVQQGAQVVVNMAASPFEVAKATRREELIKRGTVRNGVPLVYVNQVGGNDELVFDGGSCVFSGEGELLGRARSFEEDLLLVDITAGPTRCEDLQDEVTQLSRALKLGLRDYVRKCGFRSVVLGLSGGIDSSVVAALAADAVGAENVWGLTMPSRYTSDHSIRDAKGLAENLGINFHTVSIETLHSSFEHELDEVFGVGRVGTAAENIQARIRANLIMAVSNAFGHLPLATGNKSELSTGYCTLYGDMCGGLAPIGDVLKTVVYQLARKLNNEANCERIPQSVMEKAPSAELKPDQVDQDKLPPYDVLDEILRRYIEADMTPEQIIGEGFDRPTVRKVVRMVDLAEYKRKQAPPVLKVSRRAFGSGRRMPIAQRYLSGD